ncbi:MAG: TonB-dependent receptor [Bacteroidetes bacterium]|nr:TonB-dependent receptor [Bacteroidota bacterium]MBK9526593.1 TonB-dependent receptor [Bacteroidota bacterium]MBK9542681.1 TonB-dependent receptor [Bacteroidota bacterium]
MKFLFRILPLFLLVIDSSTLLAQSHTVSGFVKEDETGESLLGTNVYLKENLKGTSTNQYGFYSITVPEGKYTLVVSYLGFVTQEFPIELTKDLRINVNLKSTAIESKEVTISAERDDRNVESIDMGKDKIEVEKIKQLPAFMGEVDILKTIQLLPGVQSAGEGNSGFYVRGGGPDQNLILLDEANVYNASHLFGFFSVFNADAVQNITLTKGGMPANYGGRLASVLDIQMKEGNNKKFSAEGGIGFVSSRLTIQGPIKKDTGSFIISGRRTFIDLFFGPPFVKKSSNIYGNKYYFYDLNAKVNYRLSDRDRLFISGYFGRDVFRYKSPDSDFFVRVPWGNTTATLRWNHLFNNKLFMNTSLIYTDYQFEFEGGQDAFSFKLFSGITDYNLKSDINWLPNVRHNVKFGGQYIFHVFVPSNASAKSGDIVFDLGKILRNYAHDGSIYINDEFDLSKTIKLNGGLRYTLFQQIGPFDRFVRSPINGNVTDTLHYDAGENVKTYSHVEPRISGRLSLSPKSSLKASYTQNYQYIHLASLSGISLPTDTWIPSTDKVKPQFGTQYALGYFRNFKNNTYETSLEVYYKEMKNQVEYEEGFLPENTVNDNIDNNFVYGKGWSYGAELFLKKAKGNFSGWIGYTIAWTKRQFDDLNQGKTFYAKYDRRHDVSVVMTYELGNRWVFGATWIYATGNLNTFPQRLYVLSNGNVVEDYGGQRNNYRLPSYHRLDISATIKSKPGKKFESSWNFSIFNVYNRYNPYIIYFDKKFEENSIEIQAKQISLFPMIPSVTYNFKF